MSDAPLLVRTFARDLRCTRLTCDVVPRDSSLLRESNTDTLGQHGDDLFRGLLGDDATDLLGRGFDDGTVREGLMIDYIGLHIDASVREDAVCRRHLERCDDDTLSEGHVEEFDARPFFVWVDLTVDLALQCYIRLIPESEVINVFREEGLSDLLDDVDHADVTAPVQRVEIRMVADTFVVDVFDRVLVDVDVAFIRVHILRTDVACVDADRDGDRLEDTSRLVE